MKYKCTACYQPADCLCMDCRATLCAKHAYQRVDGNNIAITRSAPVLCRECFVKRYGRQP